MPSFTLGGMPTIVGRALRSASTTSTVLAMGCLFTRRYTALVPSVLTMLVCMSDESVTVPTSRTRTGLPCWLTFTITSRIGSTVRNWLLVKTL